MATASKVMKLVPPKKKRQRIKHLEARPQESWFVKAKDEDGKTVWGLWFHMTGLRPRFLGPFANRHKALLCLDKLVDDLGDYICNIDGYARDYRIKKRFQSDWGGCVIEDELASAYRTQKGR